MHTVHSEHRVHKVCTAVRGSCADDGGLREAALDLVTLFNMHGAGGSPRAAIKQKPKSAPQL